MAYDTETNPVLWPIACMEIITDFCSMASFPAVVHSVYQTRLQWPIAHHQKKISAVAHCAEGPKITNHGTS
jgi:hypothetical protein